MRTSAGKFEKEKEKRKKERKKKKKKKKKKKECAYCRSHLYSTILRWRADSLRYFRM